MASPPTYEEAQAQLNAFLAKGVQPSVAEKARIAMANELSKPETTQSLIDEVKALGNSAIEIDQAFERVRVDLGKVDQNNYKDKNGNPVPKMQPKWVRFQQVCHHNSPRRHEHNMAINFFRTALHEIIMGLTRDSNEHRVLHQW